jgi:L-aminopeptidase/D-esterase-like protein
MRRRGVPDLSGAMRNLLTDVAGIAVGHVTDLALGSGTTAILFDSGAVASAVILGGAPGSRDTALLEPEMTMQRIDALTLSGGSCFGLDAAGGVQAALREAGRGLNFRGAIVPIVPQAIVFDLLNGGNKDWGVFSPYRDQGYEAAKAATPGAFALGSVGAGTGATTATCKGGLGSASTKTTSGHVVAALAVVNALGAATIGAGPHFWAAPYEVDAEFGGLGWPSIISPSDVAMRVKGGSVPATTIAVIATDAILTKSQTKRLAIMANDGLARALLPAHAPSDGDSVFAVATGAVPMDDERILTELGHAATLVMARAIARGVFEAATLPYPGALASWHDRFRAGRF